MLTLRRKFPLLAPVDRKPTEFYGFMEVLNEEFKIHITLHDPLTLDGLKLKGDWRFLRLLQDSKCNLKKYLERCRSLTEFLLEIQSHLEQHLHSMPECSTVQLPPAYYGNLFIQLDKCGWEKLKYINQEWNKIHIEAIDDERRSHILQLTIPSDYSGKPILCSADLPSLEATWSSNTSLEDIYEEFVVKIAKYQSFWNCMDEIDDKVWVLEPNNPNRKNCKRRIAIASNASLQVNVDPLNPTAVPECHFYGPEQTVGPLRELLHSNLSQWDIENSLLVNLQSVLEIIFPLQCNTRKEDLHLECGICYSDTMDGKLPDILCEEAHCLQQFHHSCLYEWLKSLPSTQYSFNILFGECPYCNQQITCGTISS